MERKMRLVLNAPRNFTSLFHTPIDDTDWESPQEYLRIQQQGYRPDRARASFNSINQALQPLIHAESLQNTYGVYMLAFGDDQDSLLKAFYVGIANNSGTSSEGILNRIKKHRIKVTGSNVGANKDSVGGVNHTKGWRTYAPKRYQHFLNKKTKDDCSDARLIIGQIQEPYSKENLEFFENKIIKNEEIKRKIYSLLWQKTDGVTLLTTRTTQGTKPDNPLLVLWDGTEFDL